MNETTAAPVLQTRGIPWTREQAIAAGRRGNATRSKIAASRRLAKALALAEPNFAGDMLTRTRERLLVFFCEIDLSVARHDAKRCAEWSRAIRDLEEVERRLSGRRLPSKALEEEKRERDLEIVGPTGPIG